MRFFKLAADCGSGSSGWVKVHESEYTKAINESDFCNYRINLEKDCFGSPTTRFGATLPKLPTNICEIWYTDCNRRKQSIKLNKQDVITKSFFRSLYQEIYKSADNTECLITFPQALQMRVPGTFKAALEVLTVPIFSINVDKYVKKHLYALSKAPIVDVQEPSGDDCSYLDMVYGNVWFRRDGKFIKVVDGKVIEFGKGDPATQKMLKASNKCYTTNTNVDNVQDCHRHIFNCLLSDDTESLQKCLKNLESESDFGKLAREEINAMHPVIALRTLQRFGFHTYTVYDPEAGTRLKKVENVNHWLENYMAVTFTKEEVQKSINGNDLLKRYLNLISDFVNSNPGILNKGYTGTTVEAVGTYQPSQLVQELGINCRKEPSKEASSLYDIKRFTTYHKTSLHTASVRNNTTPFVVAATGVSTPFGSVVTPGVQMLTPRSGGQSGGGDLTNLALRKLTSGGVTSGELINGIFSAALKELEDRGKQLSATDLQRINKRIHDLTRTEDELLRNVAYIEAYNKYLDAFNDYTDSTIELGGKDGLESLVDRQNKLQGRHLGNEEYLLKLLGHVRAEESGQEYAPISLQ